MSLLSKRPLSMMRYTIKKKQINNYLLHKNPFSSNNSKILFSRSETSSTPVVLDHKFTNGKHLGDES